MVMLVFAIVNLTNFSVFTMPLVILELDLTGNERYPLMSRKIISPSTSVGQTSVAGTTGYDYTIGAQKTLPNRQQEDPLAAALYNHSLHPHARRPQVSISAYAFLFQEMVSLAVNTSKSVTEIENKLHRQGYALGPRLLELLNFRSSVTATSSRALFGKSATGPGGLGGPLEDSLASSITAMRRRDLRVLEILQFVHGPVWTYMFGRQGDDLVKSSERENEYMVVDNLPLLTQFIGHGNVQCDAFVCGIVEGILDGASFPCKVTAHAMPEDQHDRRVVYLIKFDHEVLQREALRF
ncbi:LAMI_0H02718g1_1 [Lachancea mirantina]|uniref:LAMI_0H02718g1_1 n=1 Tax=Lachancea mirantina TaxID=1230905 RepID=A0A1G4KED0_9SACH|nr:LAMI_0H02718g1_1 [Lachancea mirantina]